MDVLVTREEAMRSRPGAVRQLVARPFRGQARLWETPARAAHRTTPGPQIPPQQKVSRLFAGLQPADLRLHRRLQRLRDPFPLQINAQLLVRLARRHGLLERTPGCEDPLESRYPSRPLPGGPL